MIRSDINRKGKAITKIPEKRLSMGKDDTSSSMSGLSTDIQIHNEILNLNTPKKTLYLKSLDFNGKLLPKSLPTSPSTPFGPKTKVCIIPCKDLSENSHSIELDVLENYNIWSDIGKGSYATVKLATHKATLQRCAIKVYSKKILEDPAIKKNVLREIKILKKIDHPNIVKFIEEITGVNNLYIVMEYVKGISLNNHLHGKGLKRLDEIEACEIFTQLIKALEYCHSKNISHRDIKLENVQLDLHFNVKLIDFGFATCFTKKSLVFCGSPSYMAPEIINKEEFFGPPADIWASGIVLFLLVTGSFPYKSFNENRVFEKIKKGSFVIPEYVSPLCRRLILKVLNPVPEQRPTASEILKDLWVTSSGGSSVYASPNSGDNIEVIEEEDI